MESEETNPTKEGNWMVKPFFFNTGKTAELQFLTTNVYIIYLTETHTQQ